MIEHPDISSIERTGYPIRINRKIIGHCKSCGGEITDDEAYYTDGVIKFHEDCLILKEGM